MVRNQIGLRQRSREKGKAMAKGAYARLKEVFGRLGGRGHGSGNDETASASPGASPMAAPAADAVRRYRASSKGKGTLSRRKPSSSAAQTAAKDFPQFVLLPPELRQRIWALAIPPRVVHITSGFRVERDISRALQQMALAQVNAEAEWIVRREFERAYEAASRQVIQEMKDEMQTKDGEDRPSQYVPQAIKTVPFDPETDTVVMSWEDATGSAALPLDSVPMRVVARARHLVVLFKGMQREGRLCWHLLRHSRWLCDLLWLALTYLDGDENDDGGGGGSLTEQERPHWRCSHCGVSGTSVWAVRDGPTGPRSLCHNCGLLYERDGRLPRQLKNLHSHVARLG